MEGAVAIYLWLPPNWLSSSKPCMFSGLVTLQKGLIECDSLLVEQTKVKVLGQDWEIQFKYGLEEVTLDLQLAEKLGCEVVDIDVKNKYYKILVPPDADHKNGKETDGDKKYKVAAEKLGVATNKSQWVFLKKSDVKAKG
ncbi:hypothetical protein RhiJN_25919 [Ceratobasidium sp. AG-Ba]|nr:hypothetical protein RhiJN_25919 [Ceratobasidium sp. AG-Ba]